MKMSPSKTCSTLLAVFAFASANAFAASAYVTGVNANSITNPATKSNFGSLDLATGVYTEIVAGLTGNSFHGLTFGPSTGLLYSESGGFLNTITTMGTVAQVGSMGYDAWAMSMSGSNQIFAYNWASDTMGWVNPATGATTGAFGTTTYASRPPNYGSFAFVGSTLYTADNWAGTNTFGKVNTTTGILTTIATGSSYQYLKLAYDETTSTLYGINLNNIYTVNPLTGALSNTVAISGANWFTYEINGASVAAIPEPSAAAALCGLATLAFVTLRRRRSG